jgi:hypothetical protein
LSRAVPIFDNDGHSPNGEHHIAMDRLRNIS